MLEKCLIDKSYSRRNKTYATNPQSLLSGARPAPTHWLIIEHLIHAMQSGFCSAEDNFWRVCSNCHAIENTLAKRANTVENINIIKWIRTKPAILQLSCSPRPGIGTRPHRGSCFPSAQPEHKAKCHNACPRMVAEYTGNSSTIRRSPLICKASRLLCGKSALRGCQSVGLRFSWPVPGGERRHAVALRRQWFGGTATGMVVPGPGARLPCRRSPP